MQSSAMGSGKTQHNTAEAQERKESTYASVSQLGTSTPPDKERNRRKAFDLSRICFFYVFYYRKK